MSVNIILHNAKVKSIVKGPGNISGSFINSKRTCKWNYDDAANQIEMAVLKEREKLKPEYKNAGLLVDVYPDRSTPAKLVLDVRVKSIVNGLSTKEEVYKC